MKPEYIIGGLMVLLGLVGFLWTYFGPILDLKEKVGKVSGYNCQSIIDRVGSLETKMGTTSLTDISNRLVAVETKMSLYWDAVGDVIKDIIHHPDSPRKDYLSDKFPNLTEEEICELRDILISEKKELMANGAARDPHTRAYVLAVSLQLARVGTALVDKKLNCEK